MSSISKSILNVFKEIPDDTLSGLNNINQNISKQLKKYIADINSELVEKINKDTIKYNNAIFLKKIGFKNCSNITNFSIYTHEDMLKLLNLFKSNKTIYDKYPTLNRIDFQRYCIDKNLTIHSKKDYSGVISDDNLKILQEKLSSLEEQLPIEKFYMIMRKYSKFDNYGSEIDKEKLKEHKKTFEKEHEKGNMLHVNISGRFTVNPDSYYYGALYREIYIAENTEQTEGVFAIELNNGFYSVLFEYNTDKEKTLGFKDFVAKNSDLISDSV